MKKEIMGVRIINNGMPTGAILLGTVCQLADGYTLLIAEEVEKLLAYKSKLELTEKLQTMTEKQVLERLLPSKWAITLAKKGSTDFELIKL